MKRTSDETALMTRYLLGDVSEEEQTQLEEQFLSDDERYQQLVALEDELRYDYAQGNLTPRQRQLFEARFLKSTADRQKIELAKAVLAKANEAVRATSEPKAIRSWPRILADFFAARPVSFVSAVVAATAAVVAVGFFSQTLDLKRELSALRTQGNANQVALNVQKSREEALSRELQQERNRRQQLEQQAQKPASTPLILAFTLAPGLTRDTEGAKRLLIPPDAQGVQMQLQVKAADRNTSLRASLQNLDGSELWSQTVKADGPSLVLSLPARLLKPGDYLIELKGATAASSEYYFTVVQ